MKVKLNLGNTKLNAAAKKLFYLCNHPDDKEKSWL